MSASQKTPNYDLPIYAGSDTLNTSDWNNAMLEIDTQMHTNQNTGTTQESQISEITENVNNLTKNQQNLLTQVNDLTSTNASLVTRQTNLETHMKDIDSEISGLQQNVISLNSSNTKNESDIGALQTSVGTNTSDITELQTSVGTNTSDITELQTSVGTNTSDIIELQESVSTIQESLDKTIILPDWHLLNATTGFTTTLTSSTLDSTTNLYQISIKILKDPVFSYYPDSNMNTPFQISILFPLTAADTDTEFQNRNNVSKLSILRGSPTPFPIATSGSFYSNANAMDIAAFNELGGSNGNDLTYRFQLALKNEPNLTSIQVLLRPFQLNNKEE